MINCTVPTWLVVSLFAGTALAYLFFETLWLGGGLVGNDVYSYYHPQKAYYREALLRGELPAWNNRTAEGYPLVAESQTGVYYPPHLLAYRLWDVNTAYNALQIGHYILAFVAACLLARAYGLSTCGGLLAATIYVYGWFPARIGLEWAILGGAWQPVVLWGAERYWKTGEARFLVATAGGLTCQMLAGHYHLAFITLVALGLLMLLRGAGLDHVAGRNMSPPRAALGVTLAMLAAAGLSALQWMPTWELKQRSQRAEVVGDHDPAKGYLPTWYLAQTLLPERYYRTEQAFNAPGRVATNKTEAHLYFGRPAFLLLLWGVASGVFRRDRRWWAWGLIGGLALLYATGALAPVARHLPGFSYFEGAGRYGLLTTLAVALLAGASWTDLAPRLPPVARWPLAAVGGVWLVAELFLVCVATTHNVVYFVPRPPLALLRASPVRELLAAESAPVRLLAPGRNLPTLLGVASTDPEATYLGLSPAEYVDPQLRLPQPFAFDAVPSPAQLDWLRRHGVTHVLSFVPLRESAWPIASSRFVVDPFLNAAWGRTPDEPLALYKLALPGRVRWETPTDSATCTITRYRPDRVEIAAQHPAGGRLILADLAYPGWHVTLDGRPAESLRTADGHRALDVPAGTHTVVWTFRPTSHCVGLAISVMTVIILGAGTIWRLRSRRST